MQTGLTVMHHAARHGMDRLCTLLAKRGASVNR